MLPGAIIISSLVEASHKVDMYTVEGLTRCYVLYTGTFFVVLGSGLARAPADAQPVQVIQLLNTSYFFI